jgi:SAM-dependent methyltransferase
MIMTINYEHKSNMHGLNGPKEAFANLIPGYLPTSVLDVGCGTGTWLRAALDAGVNDVVGIDGVQIAPDRLLIPRERFLVRDLTQPVDLGRKFDLAICLEVAEHLDPAHADTLIRTLALHSDCIVFSAAAPGQAGQHHVNCQPPSAWQHRFNNLGFTCDDAVRWRLWEQAELEPWYKQNMFIARKEREGYTVETDLKMVIHPEMLAYFSWKPVLSNIENGSMPVAWYLWTPAKAIAAKVSRKLVGKWNTVFHNNTLQ